MRRLAALGIIIIALAGAGIASATVHPSHEPKGPKSCYATCATHTELRASSEQLVFGSEQSVVFKVSVEPRKEHGSGVPTGSVTVQAEGTVLCTVVLSNARGTCSPSSTALAVRNQPYKVIASYGGDANFAASDSHPELVRVVSSSGHCPHDGHGKGGCGHDDDR